ncbi:MAG: GDSL-type esterase/lipase family protein [Bacteroidota bacterium]
MLKRSFITLTAPLLLLFSSCTPVSKYIDASEVLNWEADIQVFDSLNAVENSDQNTLLVTGSSSVRLWNSIHSDLVPFQVMQRGYGGAKLTDFNHYADRIIKPHTFKAILVFVANDITGGDQDRTPREVLWLFKTLVRQIRERNPHTPVFWMETTPTPSRWEAISELRKSGDLIRRYCQRNQDLFFIDTYEVFMNHKGEPDPGYFRQDMLHLNRKGYELWSETILKALEQAGISP